MSFPLAAARYRGSAVRESRRQRKATYVASPCASFCATRLQKSMKPMELIEAMELVQLREITSLCESICSNFQGEDFAVCSRVSSCAPPHGAHSTQQRPEARPSLIETRGAFAVIICDRVRAYLS